MKTPWVDVGIPTHGRPEFLAAAIDSVQAQTLRSWRLRIAEDGPGSVAEIVEPYLPDERIELLPGGPEHLGAPANHTRLLVAGEAPYVAFLHHDDLWEPEVLACRVAFLDSHPECAFVFSSNTQIDSAGRTIGRSHPLGRERVLAPTEFTPMLLGQNPVGTPSTVLARREAYEAVGPRFAEFDFYDLEMWLRLAVRYTVGYLPVWDVAFRVHEGQITFRGRRGEQNVAFFDHIARIVERALPEAALPRRELVTRRSGASLSAALDAAEAGKRRRALRWLVAAIRLRPSSLLDARAAAVVVAMLLGRRGRGLVTRARTASRRRSIVRGVETTRSGAIGRPKQPPP